MYTLGNVLNVNQTYYAVVEKLNKGVITFQCMKQNTGYNLDLIG
ncbi:hypothetical protein PAAL109150_20700 [Paenibacillus alkaliterrae]|nr:hypothetical protein [Paenibacillus alkaliterrae]